MINIRRLRTRIARQEANKQGTGPPTWWRGEKYGVGPRVPARGGGGQFVRGQKRVEKRNNLKRVCGRGRIISTRGKKKLKIVGWKKGGRHFRQREQVKNMPCGWTARKFGNFGEKYRGASYGKKKPAAADGKEIGPMGAWRYPISKAGALGLGGSD